MRECFIGLAMRRKTVRIKKGDTISIPGCGEHRGQTACLGRGFCVMQL